MLQCVTCNNIDVTFNPGGAHVLHKYFKSQQLRSNPDPLQHDFVHLFIHLSHIVTWI